MNNFDPSKLNIDFSKDEVENKNSEIIENISEEKEVLETKNEEQENIAKEEDLVEESQSTKEEKEDVLEFLKEDKEKKLEEVSTILTDPDLRPEELKEKEKEAKIEENKESEKIIFDINIKSIDDLIMKITKEKYDFCLAEPNSEYITIKFKKDSVVKEIIYLKYNVFSNIFIKAKNISKLNLEETTKEQKGEGIHRIGDKEYNILVKTVPCEAGEKMYLKLTQDPKKAKKKKESSSITIGKAFGFLGIILFISLILGGAFLTFVVTNAQTVADVQFFRSLGINLNDINTFLLKLVGVIFSVLLFIETIFLIINIFKSFLTKKENKKKRNIHIMLAILFLAITFITGTIWMVLDKKIKSFPNWQEMSYGDVQIYDNDKLINVDFFSKQASLITDNTSIIGPVTLKFDLSYYARKETSKGFEIQKYIWEIDKERIERLTPDIIYEFNEARTYDINLTVIEKDLKGDLIEKVVSDIPAINIDYTVEKNETILSNGGKTVEFNASGLRNLGEIEWYFTDNLENPAYVGENFKPSKIFFEDTLIGMYIKAEGKSSDSMDKVFIIKSNTGEGIKGDIEAIQDLDNDLKFTLQVKNPETDFGNGFIEEFKWIIGDKTVTKKADITNLEESSEIEYIFSEYGDKEIKVQLIDSSSKIKEITKTIEIPKRIRLKTNLEIINEGVAISDYEFDNTNGEYFLYNLPVPTTLTLNAKKVRADNLLYTLKDVEWDFGLDGDIDKKGKEIQYELATEDDYTIGVEYTFVHRKKSDEIVKKKEVINIEGVKKEAILSLKIDKESDYAPVIVSFDASESQVKGHDIVKFIYDYGDGTEPEERDSINKGHKYITNGDYNVKLTVVTEEGVEYSITKKLILKPQPEEINISASMKKARVGQNIDFSSADSKGQIKNYIWDFGDGNISTEANPEHSFDKIGTYNVKLKVEFENRNILDDEIEIVIY